jgi:hypothetical protein
MFIRLVGTQPGYPTPTRESSMNAQDLPVTQLLDGAKQFIVPIFQRDYSWGTKHCLQLWNDFG